MKRETLAIGLLGFLLAACTVHGQIPVSARGQGTAQPAPEQAAPATTSRPAPTDPAPPTWKISFPAMNTTGQGNEPIQKVLKANLGAFEACFDQAHARGVARIGHVYLGWQITADGHPSNLHDATKALHGEGNKSQDAEYLACVSAAVEALRFAPVSYSEVLLDIAANDKKK